MLIQDIMKRNVITLSENALIEDAIHIVNHKRIRHIPIISDNGNVTGIVSDQDIRDASPSIFHANEHLDDVKKAVTSIMTEEVITAHPLDSIAEAAILLYENHIGCLPVTEEGQLIGIVTETDILHTLVELMGAHQPSTQINVRVPNTSGQLADVATRIKDRKTNITSVLVYPDKNDATYKILAFRLQTMDPRGIIDTLKLAGYEVLWPNIPGMTL